MYVFDIETLGTESTSVVLSAAIIEFDMESDFTYKELIERATFVKFDAKEQIQKYGRTVDKTSLEWWNKQCSHSRKQSLTPSSLDVFAIDGIDIFRDVIKPGFKIWTRGSLDQIVFDSLCKSVGTEPIAHYKVWRDIRTAVDLLRETSRDGYCKIRDDVEFDGNDVIKHDPVHDCAYDIMMLRYGV